MTQRIDILTTGAMPSQRKDAVASSGEDVVDHAVNALHKCFPGVEFVVRRVCCRDSSQMTTDILWGIGVQVSRSFQDGADGVVVTHSTDTIEETAYFLDLVGDFSGSGLSGSGFPGTDDASDKQVDEGSSRPNGQAQASDEDDSHGPVVQISEGISMESSFGPARGRISGSGPKAANGPTVITGSIRRAGEMAPQGLANLLASCKVALEPDSAQYGALVVANGEIHLAREVVKVNSWILDAFESPVCGPVGFVGSHGVDFVAKPLRRSCTRYTALVPPVDLVTASIGPGDRSIPALVDVGCRGLVVESLGYGNLPQEMVRDLQSAAKRNVPVVITTRCLSGGAPNPGTVDDSGFVATNLPGPKARIKLMLALSVTNDASEIAQIFAQYP